MNVVLYRKYVVYGWTPVLSSELSDVFRSVYDAERVWLINGQILLGWVWKNMYRPVISTQLCDYKQICQNDCYYLSLLFQKAISKLRFPWETFTRINLCPKSMT